MSEARTGTDRAADHAARRRRAKLTKVSGSGWVRERDADAARKAIRDALAPFVKRAENVPLDA